MSLIQKAREWAATGERITSGQYSIWLLDAYEQEDRVILFDYAQKHLKPLVKGEVTCPVILFAEHFSKHGYREGLWDVAEVLAKHTPAEGGLEFAEPLVFDRVHILAGDKGFKHMSVYDALVAPEVRADNLSLQDISNVSRYWPDHVLSRATHLHLHKTVQESPNQYIPPKKTPVSQNIQYDHVRTVVLDDISPIIMSYHPMAEHKNLETVHIRNLSDWRYVEYLRSEDSWGKLLILEDTKPRDIWRLQDVEASMLSTSEGFSFSQLPFDEIHIKGALTTMLVISDEVKEMVMCHPNIKLFNT